MPKFLPFLFIIVAGNLFCSCSGDSKKTMEGEVLFELISSSDSGIDFENNLSYTEEFNTYTYRNFYNGAGVGLGDFNNDGLTDIYFAGNISDNKLYLNKGDLKFEDITDQAGVACNNIWSTGVSIADINGDGFQDIYVCKSGSPGGENRYNELFINNGDLTFSEKAEEYGIDDKGLSAHAAFFDFDKDGDLDCYLLNNSFSSVSGYSLIKDQREIRDPLGGNKFYRNDNNHFTDISEEAGIFGSAIGFGLGVSIGDFNNDSWLDIYVCNDFFERDYLYINNRNGQYTESLESYMREISMGSMGSDFADINNDGLGELFVTEMTPEPEERLKTKALFQSWEQYEVNLELGYYKQFARNVLQLNNGNNSFSEIGRYSNVYATDWSWGALIMDLDNDGWKDIFVANGIYKDLLDLDYADTFSNSDMVRMMIKQEEKAILKMIDAIPSQPVRNYVFKNNRDLTFTNKAESWGLNHTGFSNGAGYGDLDNDGDLDLVVNNVNSAPYLYRNLTRESNDNAYIALRLHGDRKNTRAIGSRVSVFASGSLYFQQLIPMRGFQSTSDSKLNFGLGQQQKIDSILILWPDDRKTMIGPTDVNQLIEVHIDSAKMADEYDDRPIIPKAIFSEVIDNTILNFKHEENEFSDFKREKLIFHMMSNQGPKITTGDVNGDGFTDIHLGGAKDNPGQLFMQKADGSFDLSVQPALEKDRTSEDVDAVFFDADGDSDLDLYVASGGNEFGSSSSALFDRLYFNNGKGIFYKSEQVLPNSKFENSSCVSHGDYDNDGDHDLFVGLRLKPFLYGVPVNGYILNNDGNGNFNNVTSSIAPELMGIGMITDMSWADVDNDHDLDIVVVGDYMGIHIFKNINNQFVDLGDNSGLANTMGWWNTIETADLDNDGDLDFVVGNHGLNSRFKASIEKPVTMYVNDFDRNGRVEQIICRYNGDVSYPIVLKKDLIEQIPNLKDKYPNFDSYKDQRIEDIFSPDIINSSEKLIANYMYSAIIINEGDDKFNIVDLPKEAQFTPIYAIHVFDYNQDNHLDILLGGNLYKAKPETGIYDGSYGVLLIGDGNNNFEPFSYEDSGFEVKGEIRDIEMIDIDNKKLIFAGRNNLELKIFEINNKIDDEN